QIEALQDRFLGRPAGREMLRRPLPRLAVADLPLRVHAPQKQLAMLLDHVADAHAFDDVCTDSNDFHDRSPLFTASGWLLLILAKNDRPGTIRVVGHLRCQLEGEERAWRTKPNRTCWPI